MNVGPRERGNDGLRLEKLFRSMLKCLMLSALNFMPAYAQPSDSLSQYLGYAAHHNPGALQKYDEYRAALEKAPQAASLPPPRLDIGYFLNPMQQPGGDQVAEFKLMQMFPWFGALSAAKEEAAKMAVAKFEAYRAELFRLRRDVKSVWYRAYRIKKEIDITRQNLEFLKALERLALAKMKTGQSSPAQMSGGKMPAAQQKSGNTGGGLGMGDNDRPEFANVLRIRIEMLALENRLSLLQDQLQTEEVRFNSYLGRSPDAAVALPDTLAEAKLPASLSFLRDGLSQNPMVKMSLAEKEAYEAKNKMVSRMSWPMLGIGAGYIVMQKRDGNPSMMNGDDMLMPMVSLTLPIYRKKYLAMRREAEYQRDAAARGAQDALLGLQVRYHEALQMYEDGGRRKAMVARQAALARQSIEVLTAAFASGGDNFDALLRLQQELLDYEFKEIKALVDRNTAAAGLEALAGPDAVEWRRGPNEE